ncbi:MAG: cell division protein FtsQ/DivIB, partial [Bryobacteraceae bacterium]
VHASRDDIARVFAADFGQNIFRVPIEERRRKLLAIDWVADATVARIWPNRLTVRIEERRPVAFVHLRQGAAGTRPALIDAEGVILRQPARARFSFPLVSGIDERQPESARRDKVRRMLRLVKELGETAARVTEVDVSSAEILTSIEVDGREVELLVGESNYGQRVRNFLKHYPEIRKGSAAVSSFDLRLDDRITARE